jgi:hypothetical protein
MYITVSVSPPRRGALFSFSYIMITRKRSGILAGNQSSVKISLWCSISHIVESVTNFRSLSVMKGSVSRGRIRLGAQTIAKFSQVIRLHAEAEATRPKNANRYLRVE